MKQTHAQYLIKHIWTNQGLAQRFFFITAGLNVTALSVFGWIMILK